MSRSRRPPPPAGRRTVTVANAAATLSVMPAVSSLIIRVTDDHSESRPGPTHRDGPTVTVPGRVTGSAGLSGRPGGESGSGVSDGRGSGHRDS